MRLGLVTAALVLALPASALAMTKADAVNLANQVNLVGADLPGYSVMPPDPSSSSDPKMQKCSGSVPSKMAIADIPSANFDHGLLARFREINSEVVVYPSDALASKDFNAVRSKRAQHCVVKDFKGRTVPGVGRVATVTLTVLKPAVAGTFGYRITLHVRHGFGTVPLVLDVFEMHQGPVEVSLASVSGAKGKLRGSEANRLLGLLQTRLSAALTPNTVV